MPCRGLCDRLSPLKPIYANGVKYCSTCGFFLMTEDVYCFCCRYRLRCRELEITPTYKVSYV